MDQSAPASQPVSSSALHNISLTYSDSENSEDDGKEAEEKIEVVPEVKKPAEELKVVVPEVKKPAEELKVVVPEVKKPAEEARSEEVPMEVQEDVAEAKVEVKETVEEKERSEELVLPTREKESIQPVPPKETVQEPEKPKVEPKEQVKKLHVEVQAKAPIEVQTKEPLEVQAKGPVEVQAKAPIEVQTKEPLEIQAKEPFEVQAKAPIEVQTKEPLKVQAKGPIEVQIKEPLEVLIKEVPSQVPAKGSPVEQTKPSRVKLIRPQFGQQKPETPKVEIKPVVEEPPQQSCVQPLTISTKDEELPESPKASPDQKPCTRIVRLQSGKVVKLKTLGLSPKDVSPTGKQPEGSSPSSETPTSTTEIEKEVPVVEEPAVNDQPLLTVVKDVIKNKNEKQTLVEDPKKEESALSASPLASVQVEKEVKDVKEAKVEEKQKVAKPAVPEVSVLRDTLTKALTKASEVKEKDEVDRSSVERKEGVKKVAEMQKETAKTSVVVQKPKTLPPLPRLEKLNIKQISPVKVKGPPSPVKLKSPTSPVKIKSPTEQGRKFSPEQGLKVKISPELSPETRKRNLGVHLSPRSEKKQRLDESLQRMSSSPDVTMTLPNQIENAELRELLTKRLGAGLDISILPVKSKEQKFKIGDVEIRRSVKEPMRSPPGPKMEKTPYQQRLELAQQSYQASFSNLIPKQHQQQQHSVYHMPTPRHKLMPQPPQQHHPQILAQRKPAVDARRLKSPEHKVPPLRVNLKDVEKKPPPPEIVIDSSNSSVEDNSKTSDSASSQAKFAQAHSEIDFEKIIGTTIVRKKSPLPPQVESQSTDTPHVKTEESFTSICAKQPAVVIEPIDTPKKRGRPRKTDLKPMSDPYIEAPTWPYTYQTPNSRRAERRKRREEAKIDITPKRPKEEVEEVEVGEEEDDADTKDESKCKKEDEGDKGEGEEVKKRYIPRPPIKKKRRRGAYSVKRKPSLTPAKKKMSEKENIEDFEDETRMSGTGDSLMTGDESQGSSAATAETRNINKKGRMEQMVEECKPPTVQQLAEYYWPPLQPGAGSDKPEGLMIQEQISEYLGVKSFKRKYPSIKRRQVGMEERNYLQENNFVTEKMCDMGLTVIYAADVIEIMYNDFSQKFDEYRKYTREKKAKEQKALREKQAAERADADPRQDAIESMMAWNAEFNKSRREKRGACMDLQTFSVHFPRGKFKQPVIPRVGSYPVALLPGQNTDYYKTYTPTELKYFPLNTVLYGPLKPNEMQHGMRGGSDGSQSDSDDSSSSGDSSSSSSGDSQDSDDSSSEEEENKSVKNFPPKEKMHFERFDDMSPFSLTMRGKGRSRRATPRGIYLPVKRTPTPRARSAFDSRFSSSGKRLGRPPKVKLEIKLERVDEKMDCSTTSGVDGKTVESLPAAVMETCKMCHEVEGKNKIGLFESFIDCSQCKGKIHPTCLDLTEDMLPKIKAYKWQCTDCKSCVNCKSSTSEDKLIFCDKCDRGYHIFCVGLKKVPTGNYICIECSLLAGPPPLVPITVQEMKTEDVIEVEVQPSETKVKVEVAVEQVQAVTENKEESAKQSVEPVITLEEDKDEVSEAVAAIVEQSEAAEEQEVVEIVEQVAEPVPPPSETDPPVAEEVVEQSEKPNSE